MTFLSKECPRLQSLKLWGPDDRKEGPKWVQTCKKDEPWVQAILQIKSLRYFDIPVITGGVIYNYPEFTAEFLPWLKKALVNDVTPPGVDPNGNTTDGTNQPFRFLSLPLAVRMRVYRHLLLPSDRRIHIGVGRWNDDGTENILSLFLTCKQIYAEASPMLYDTAVFTSPLLKYNSQLFEMVQYHYSVPGPHLSGYSARYKPPAPIKHIRFVPERLVYEHGRTQEIDFLEWLFDRTELETLELIIDNRHYVDYMNEEWILLSLPWEWDLVVGKPEETAENRSEGESRGKSEEGSDKSTVKPKNVRTECGKWRGRWSRLQLATIARIPSVMIEAPPEKPIRDDCLQWLTTGLRQEFLKGSSKIPHLEWLYSDLSVIGESHKPQLRRGNT